MTTTPERAFLQPPVRDEELGLLPVLRIWFGDEEFWADCGNCGQRLSPATIRPDQSIEEFADSWERHAMTTCVARSAS